MPGLKLKIVCHDDDLERRMREGRGITDENWINGSKSFNRWLWENADKTAPKMTLIDASDTGIAETAAKINRWIMERMRFCEP